MSDPSPLDATPGEQSEQGPALMRMAGVLLSHETLDSVLQLIASLAQQTLPGTAGAGVTVVDEHGKRTRVASNAMVEHADALQYELDEGPCLTAGYHRQLVRIDDVERDARWPRWAKGATRLGIRAVLSTPLITDDESIGAIKVYSRQPRIYQEHAEDVLRLFAQQAAILLVNIQSYGDAVRLNAHLKEALHTRDIVSQAKGVLIARGAPDDEAAYEILLSASRRSSEKLRVVARRLVTSTTSREAPPDTGPPDRVT